MNRLPLAANRSLAPGWYPLCFYKQVGRTPRRWMLAGVPYVVYRTKAGPSVLLDRCPHRNVPLSGGQVVDDAIECPYHGWRFRSDGQCTHIPGRLEVPKASHRVESFPSYVHQGIVFIGLNVTPESRPFYLKEQESADYQQLVRHVTFPASLFSVVENALDVPHTSVLHRGLFRTGVRHKVLVTLRRYSSWLEAQYTGEPAPSGWLGRMLSAGSGDELRVTHYDRFFLPGVLQVEYQLGPKAHVILTGYLKPMDDRTTELFVQVCVKTPLWRAAQWLLLLLVEPFARLISKQDVKVLRAQTENVEQFSGSRFMSTEIDVMFAGLSRLLKDAGVADEAHWDEHRDPTQEPREQSEFFMET